MLTYVGAALSLSGFVLERLQPGPDVPGPDRRSFVTLVTPAAVGGAALNIRYLRKSGCHPADAVASVGVSQVIAFALHVLLLLVFAALTGTMTDTSLRPPDWAYIAVAVLVSVVLIVLAVPAWRRLLLSRLAPTLGQVIPRLLDIAQRPAKLAEGIGGALLVTAAYIGCLDVSVRALGGSLPIISIAVVYLTGNAIGSAVPTPGGLGAVEAALSAGLTAAGLSGATAISSVLLFRTITFWLPVPIGWAALNYLQRHDALQFGGGDPPGPPACHPLGPTSGRPSRAGPASPEPARGGQTRRATASEAASRTRPQDMARRAPSRGASSTAGPRRSPGRRPG